jgi:ABC-type phosphate transport system substrate-binding protein
MKIIKIISLFSLLCLGITAQANAAIAIIVNPDNTNQLDERIVRQIYLGQIKSFPDGSEAKTYDNLAEEQNLRTDFVTKVLRRNPSTMNAYWARMIFTAKATPPQELTDSSAVKKMVANSRNAIGYIDSGSVDESVRVIATIE